MSVVNGHIFFCVIASAVERSTRNIALTAAAVNIKFFANLLIADSFLGEIYLCGACGGPNFFLLPPRLS